MAKPPLSRHQPSPSRHAAVPTLKQLRTQAEQYPENVDAWKALGSHLLDAGDLAEAKLAAEKATALKESDGQAWLLLAQIEAKSDRTQTAEKYFERARALLPRSVKATHGLACVLVGQERYREAMTFLDEVLVQDPKHVGALLQKARILSIQACYHEASDLFKTLLRLDPRNAPAYWIDLGHIHRDLSQFDEAESCYRQAAQLSPTFRAIALSNLLTLLHYMPGKSAEDIRAVCLEWGELFSPKQQVNRPRPSNRSAQKIIRVGMFSNGFRQHPVGAMTLPALEHLKKYGIEIYTYTGTPVSDTLTERMIRLSRKWTSIAQMSDLEFAQQLRDDEIDILIDLAGHMSGARMSAVVQEPAPIIVKWVGGLINTTGVKAIDYLITDSIESPPGTDGFYTEKLIRMPDDYICYLPPASIPDVGELPALRNGYVTFGCFNNPTKLNDTLLAQWATLLHAVQGSRLYLKSGPLGDPARQKQILESMAAHGIAPDRLRIEGRSKHYQLFECYNEVDIALDPWPYSGGLTTCEALLMGVPVVTLPGPTFAGRHSATHLANVGMPELVTTDWEEYRARVTELASNLELLGTIRSHLRKVLLDSPVCNGAKFGRHLADALRAVWQRYCEDRPPAALAFTPEGQPWFEDEDAATVVQHPEVEDDSPFSFSFKGRIITLDHGGTLANSRNFVNLSELRTLTTIAIDPAGNVQAGEGLRASGHLEHFYTHFALGDGGPTALYACLETGLTSTLQPLPSDRQLSFVREGASVLTHLPVSSVRLDDIEGLSRVDWLVLDDRHDNLKIIRAGTRLIGDALLVQVRVMFAPVYENQPDLGSLTTTLSALGLRLLQINPSDYRSYFPADLKLEKTHSGSQLFSADAVFIPDDARLQALDDNRRLKLAFLLHAVYQANDAAYSVLKHSNEQIARRYLESNGCLQSNKKTPDFAAPPALANARSPAAQAAAPEDQDEYRQFGFAYYQALCKAIEKHTAAVERALPGAYSWRGMNLRHAVERQLYFAGANSRPLFLTYLHAIGKSVTAPQLDSPAEKALAPFLGEGADPVIDYSGETMEKLPYGSYTVAPGSLKAVRGQVLARIIHSKFALYLDPILKGLQQSSYCYFPSLDDTLHNWLQEHGYASVAALPQRTVRQTAACSSILLNYKGLIQDADATLDTLKQLRPKCVVVAEGNAPADIITLEACKLLGIPCYCVQQGWAPYVHTGFRNMTYTGMFVWGEKFAQTLAPWNLDQKFHVSGSHVLPRRADMVRKDAPQTIGFFLQWPGSVLLSHRAHQAFLELLLKFAASHPDTPVIVRSHPGSPLPEKLEEALLHLRNVRISDPFQEKLASVLEATTVAVGIFSTVLLEAMQMGAVPLICSIGAFKKYPFDLAAMGMGLEVDNTQAAYDTLASVVREPALLAPLLQRQQEMARVFFAEQDATSFICRHLDAVASGAAAS